MSYPHTWWVGKPFDPYKDGRIYLSDGRSTYGWAFTGDPALIVTYEEWKKVEKPEHVIKPLPFVIKGRLDCTLEKENDKHIHGL